MWGFPRWLLVGLALGAAFSVVVAGVFVAGARLFPDSATARRADAGGDRERPGEAKRRAEIRRYLQRIDEPYAEDHLVCGQRVAFYLPKRDVAVTFDAHAYFRIDGSRTRAVLIEHEMPGAHLGGRLPFETPEIERETDERDAVGAAFAALGLPRGASADRVKSAYRTRVKEVHPDHGGDEEAFRRVREAYSLAKEHSERVERA
ncbi:J domain-containing protein [Halostella sp. JP-L12]|nr:J domain-containing protein [Halostella sp. JP-L12]